MRRFLLPVLALVTVLPLLGGGMAAAQSGDDAYDVQIRRTDNGIPHIEAADYASLGFGYGLAFAEDNICTAADFYITVNGERSKFFGPDGRWTFQGNGTSFNNLDTDFYFQAVNEAGIIEGHLAQAPPLGPRPEINEAVVGYVDGYNAYLASIGGADGVTDPRCAGEEWVRPIRVIDVYRRFYQLASLASAGVAFDGIGSAAPVAPSPGLGASAPAFRGSAEEAAVLEIVNDPATVERFDEILGGIGSNAYGFGSEATDNGMGIVLGNPHFPWQGGERLYQSHLTIPGVLDVSGASLLGVPLILIGHTDGLAWSHTVSTARRFTIFQLTLNPLDATQYVVDGQPRDMVPYEATVEVRQDDGSLVEQTRTLYRTEYGWMLESILGLPIFPWTPTTAFALGDANDHLRYMNHFFEKNHAQSTDELAELTDRNLGVPWVNTIAADRDGNAYYSDVSVVPHVTDEQIDMCSSPGVGNATFAALRVAILDGSRGACAWGTDEDAPVPGIFGVENLPRLVRDDYVTNSNDSYWLSNPDEPLEGFDGIIGDERTTRTTRTRNGLVQVIERLDGADEYTAIHPDRMTQDIVQDIVFNNRQYPGELVRDDLVTMCEDGGGSVPNSGGSTTDTTQDGVDACQVLADWDLRENLDSNGAILFRRFWGHATGATGGPWVNGFDVNDPVNTPNTLDTSNPEVQAALGDAIDDLVGAEIPLDAPLAGWQYEDLGDGTKIDIHGGPGSLGNFNAINVGWDGDPDDDGESGYPAVNHGSSFVMVAQFVDPATNDGCGVDADAIVTYSQSEDVTSPWFNDQTQMYSVKEWNQMYFCEDEIAANVLEEEDLDEVDTTPGGVSVQPIDDVTIESTALGVYRATTGGDVFSVTWQFGDGSPQVAGERVEHRYARAGTYEVTVTVTATNGRKATETFTVTVVDTADIDRVAGETRVDTAIAASVAGFRDASRRVDAASTAILARADDFPDALAGGALAVAENAPLLLTDRDRLPTAVESELRRLGVEDVIILGGEQAVSAAVADRLDELGLRVERIAGDDRFATAAAIAARVGAADTGEVVLTLGAAADPNRAWPDALSAGALAASPDRLPVLLTRGDAVPPATMDALRDLDASEVLLLGGPVAISSAAEDQLRAAGYSVRRLAGEDRYATSAAVVQDAMRRRPTNVPVHVSLVTGANFPDGLAAAGLAGARDGVVLLVPPTTLGSSDPSAIALQRHADQFDLGAVLGGPVAVAEQVRTAAEGFAAATSGAGGAGTLPTTGR